MAPLETPRIHTLRDQLREFTPYVGWISVLPLPFLLGMLVRWFPNYAHDGRVAGNLGFVVLAAIAMWGTLLAILSLRWPVIRSAGWWTLAVATAYFLHGVVLGNGRWAALPWRWTGYVAMLGGLWLSAWLVHRRSPADAVAGLLARWTAVLGYTVGFYEVQRQMDRILSRPSGTIPADQVVAWVNYTDHVRMIWTGGIWAVYLAVLLVVAWRIRSRSLARWAVVGAAVCGLFLRQALSL